MSDLMTRFTNALDCCGTCAGGVLAAYVREAKAQAWDEGHRTPVLRGPDDCRCGAWNDSECGCGEYGTGPILTPNPYRSTPS